jgi:Outer membrane protein beta-barrel domain
MAKVKYLIQLCILCALCFSTSITIAQDDDEDLRTFFGGVMFGVNASQISGDGIEGYRKVGLNFGAMTYIKLDENLALSMEMLYNEKGARYWKGVDPNIVTTTGKKYSIYKSTLPYAEIPFLLNVFDKNKSNAGLGISYGRLFNQKEILDSANIEPLFPFRKDDLNLIINGTLMVSKHFGINLRFNYSLLNIRKIPNLELLHRPQQFTRMFTLRATYLF